MPVFQRSITNELGNVVPGASVEVRDQVTSGLVQLYSDYDLSAAIGNPTAADPNGFVRFYVSAGRYRIEASADGFERVWENEVLGVDGTLFGDVRRYGAVGDDATSNTTDLQAALNTNDVVRVPAGVYRTGALVMSRDGGTLLLEPGATLRFPTLGAGVKAISVQADYCTISGGKLLGPSAGSYVADEVGIDMRGTSSAARRTGLKVIGTEIEGFGSHGIYGKWLTDVLVDDCYIHDCGYAGAMFLSSNKGRLTRNRVETMTPGTASNMYGFSLTHDSTNYSSDPDAGTKDAANPFCWDWVVTHNHIEDLNWEGIDTHGTYEVTVAHNNVYATKFGIAVASGSGDAANYAGWQNKVLGNTIDARRSDGTASGRENTGYGINIGGGTTVPSQSVVVANNILFGKGIPDNANSGAIQAPQVRNVLISGNIIRSWGGCAINADSALNVNIDGGLILELADSGDTAGYAISLGSITSGHSIQVRGVRLTANGGTAAAIGVRALSVTSLPLFADNDFDEATSTAYSLAAAFTMTTRGGAVMLKTVNNAGSGETIDIAPMRRYRDFVLSVSSSNGSSVITNLTNGTAGQRVLMHNPAATAWALNRDNSALAGGANFSANANDNIYLLKMGSLWTEISRAVNS